MPVLIYNVMNPVPWFLKIASGWPQILVQLNSVSNYKGWPPYSAEPTRYRFSGWGLVGFPPALACNIYYCPPVGDIIDLGRFVG